MNRSDQWNQVDETSISQQVPWDGCKARRSVERFLSICAASYILSCQKISIQIGNGNKPLFVQSRRRRKWSILELLDFININAVCSVQLRELEFSTWIKFPVLRLSNQKSEIDFANMCRLMACWIAETDFDVKVLSVIQCWGSYSRFNYSQSQILLNLVGYKTTLKLHWEIYISE